VCSPPGLLHPGKWLHGCHHACRGGGLNQPTPPEFCQGGGHTCVKHPPSPPNMQVLAPHCSISKGRVQACRGGRGEGGARGAQGASAAPATAPATARRPAAARSAPGLAPSTPSPSPTSASSPGRRRWSVQVRARGNGRGRQRGAGRALPTGSRPLSARHTPAPTPAASRSPCPRPRAAARPLQALNAGFALGAAKGGLSPLQGALRCPQADIFARSGEPAVSLLVLPLVRARCAPPGGLCASPSIPYFRPRASPGSGSARDGLRPVTTPPLPPAARPAAAPRGPPSRP
jgi:hypothetical protein